MADGRHLENAKFAISLQWFECLWDCGEICHHDAKLPLRTLSTVSSLTKMADRRYFKY